MAEAPASVPNVNEASEASEVVAPSAGPNESGDSSSRSPDLGQYLLRYSDYLEYVLMLWNLSVID